MWINHTRDIQYSGWSECSTHFFLSSGKFPWQGILKIPAFDHNLPVVQEWPKCCFHVVEAQTSPLCTCFQFIPSWNFQAMLSLIKLSEGFQVMSVQLSFLKSFSKCSNAEAALFIHISLRPFLWTRLSSVLICTWELITGRCGSH